jgi:hypothetical protein
VSVKQYAAYSPDGKRLGPPRFTAPMAEQDAAALRKKGVEAEVKLFGELRG